MPTDDNVRQLRPVGNGAALEGLFSGDQSDPATCACGEGWFVLTGDEQVAPHGAVSVTNDGRVTGYHGELRCLSCGSPGPQPPEVLTYG